MDVKQAILSRHSVRAFTQQKVSRQTIEEILTIAMRAPSGANTQPWKVYIVAGKKKDVLVEKVSAVVDASVSDKELAAQYQEYYPYYPQKWISPYIDRRRENGWGLYGLLDIKKGDREKMHIQHLRNYRFFDAPVALFFTTHQIMGDGAKMDIAMLMQNIMLLAKEFGLDTCAQAAWNAYHQIVLEVIGAQEDEVLIAAMALGYADSNHLVNTFYTPRVPLADVSVWLDEE